MEQGHAILGRSSLVLMRGRASYGVCLALSAGGSVSSAGACAKSPDEGGTNYGIIR